MARADPTRKRRESRDREDNSRFAVDPKVSARREQEMRDRYHERMEQKRKGPLSINRKLQQNRNMIRVRSNQLFLYEQAFILFTLSITEGIGYRDYWVQDFFPIILFYEFLVYDITI